ncbi:efflux RND transporter periplasmic adaptor subunit [Corallincola holothuriorum]|uniref:Efflux RND transporter periplasmic adaptor subunit n=1 Tax=Corallincola holothuriorum TaxID=2282215 RepID=A0A368NQK2_9GAMM|nr:efflux RND transporter periplasmic adaptor subunit [Corallincola holothuriorum]RCU51551.1 efflux RND transporter periplasmic adaptor subunit [Corallincola holothuriorum]
MNKKWLKWVVPLAVLGAGAAGMMAIGATAQKSEETAAVDTRPTVSIQTLEAIDFQVKIASYGEVKPLESTMLAAQVSGEVVNWNPNFTAGGLVKRNDILFSIENDNYEVAVLQAEANLSRARAALIEEQAKSQVAQTEANRMKDRKVSDLYLRKPQVMSAKADVQSAEAALKLARRDLENCEVRAPYDALVIERDLGAGQFVNVGDKVGELSSIESAEVVFPIPGFDSAFLPNELTGRIATVMTKGRMPVVRQATIDRDLGIVDNATRMGHLVARIDDPYSLNSDAPKLKFGSYVEVAFDGIVLSGVYQVSQDLISNRTAWLLDAENKLQPVQVDVLREEGETFLVSAGLNDGDKLVLTLPEYPQKGMEVKLSETAVAAVAKAE